MTRYFAGVAPSARDLSAGYQTSTVRLRSGRCGSFTMTVSRPTANGPGWSGIGPAAFAAALGVGFGSAELFELPPQAASAVTKIKALAPMTTRGPKRLRALRLC